MKAELVDVEFKSDTKELVLYESNTYRFIKYVDVPQEMVQRFSSLFQNEVITPAGQRYALHKNVVHITTNSTEWRLFLLNVCVLYKRDNLYTQPQVYAVRR